ncbi:MAG TPA: DUF169 domain-containing protein [Gemmatimonadales bacterium]|nr:DUF169 domain-containing protein [Gemmatimonadales bacterium]
MNTAAIADGLTAALELDITPVALARRAGAPAGVPAFEGAVPSTCTFWRRAEAGVFYATAPQHFGCPLGAMVMGFDLTPEVNDELKQLVGFMVNAKYIEADEPARIPHLDRPAAGVVYGPLRRFPIDPEFILVWLTAAQAMLLSEATGSAHWTVSEPAGALGRPACAAIPLAGGRGATTLSLGCTGMRTYTEIADDRVLAVIPAQEAATLVAALTRLAETNRGVAAFHRERKASVLT